MCIRDRSRVDDTVKDSIGYCRITNHVIPVGCGVLRGYDDGFPFMPVFNNFKQYGTFFGIKRHEEQVLMIIVFTGSSTGCSEG